MLSFRFKLRQQATDSLDGNLTWEMLAGTLGEGSDDTGSKKERWTLKVRVSTVHVKLERLLGETFCTNVVNMSGLLGKRGGKIGKHRRMEDVRWMIPSV